MKRPGVRTNREFSEEAVQVLVAGGGWGRWERTQAGGTEDGLSVCVGVFCGGSEGTGELWNMFEDVTK